MKYFADRSFTGGTPKSSNVKHSNSNSELEFLEVTLLCVLHAKKRKLFDTIADPLGNVKRPLKHS
jgi:hypothetical protein